MVAAPRWVLSREPTTAFDIWQAGDPPLVCREHGSPPSWFRYLRHGGYQVLDSPQGDEISGHAQGIRVTCDGILTGAADRNATDGALAWH